MDQGKNSNSESLYLAYLQLVKHVLENLIVVDHVVFRLRNKIHLQNVSK
jgi:hypothetical protein